MPLHPEILSRLLAELPSPAPCLRELHIQPRWIIACCERYAMSSAFRADGKSNGEEAKARLGNPLGRPVRAIAEQFAASEDVLELGLVEACLNASLPVPENLFEANALDLLGDLLPKCPSCFIGHFTQAEAWRAQGWPVNIIELNPGPGDIHWNDARPVLREAEIVFITGLTLLNGTFLEVLDRTPNAQYRVLLGPTVPCSPVLFEYGVHLIGSTFISDLPLLVEYFARGGGGIGRAPSGALRKVVLTNRPELRTKNATDRDCKCQGAAR
jgi:uncharacterized protein